MNPTDQELREAINALYDQSNAGEREFELKHKLHAAINELAMYRAQYIKFAVKYTVRYPATSAHNRGRSEKILLMGSDGKPLLFDTREQAGVCAANWSEAEVVTNERVYCYACGDHHTGIDTCIPRSN